MIDITLFYIIAIPAVLVTGISKGGFGSGLGVLAVPAMATVKVVWQAVLEARESTLMGRPAAAEAM